MCHLPNMPGRVTGSLELFGDDVAVERQVRDIVDGPQRSHAPVEPIDPANGVDARASTVLAAHQRGPGRCAVLAVVMVQQFHALLGQAIDMRRLVIPAAVAGEIGVTEVVGHDENNIRPPVLRIGSLQNSQRCDHENQECGGSFHRCLWSWRLVRSLT